RCRKPNFVTARSKRTHCLFRSGQPGRFQSGGLADTFLQQSVDAVLRTWFMLMTRILRTLALALLVSASSVQATASMPLSSTKPLRSLVSVEGVRENQLLGYGLVVGLQGT